MPKPKYAIINDFDAPHPAMVVQWVSPVGYCYLDRTKASYDGMRGDEATNIEDFGFRWAENPDGTVSFYMSDIPPIATYSDGEIRIWQSPIKSFERRVLPVGIARNRAEAYRRVRMDAEPRPLWDVIAIGLETGQESVVAHKETMDNATILVNDHIPTCKSEPVFFSWRFHSTENAS